MPSIYPTASRQSLLRWLFLLISLVCAAPLAVTAQLVDQPPFVCGTENLSLADRQTLEAQAALAMRIKQASGAAFTAITYIPIRPHIIRRANGTGGYTMARLNNVMALTNKYYIKNGVGIQFYFSGTTPDYVDNDALYAQYRQNTDDATVAPRDVNNALNQYYVQQFDLAGLGGYAKFPEDNVASTRTIIKDGDDEDRGNRLVPHELGHTFNLLHTHEPFYGYERVTRGTGANCTTAGDLVCDTPADPYGRFTGATSACVTGCPPTYSCSFFDSQGQLYTPSPTNIMSYYFPCTHDFTAGQYNRIEAGLALRQTHTSYTLNAPPTAMSAPLNVIASAIEEAIVLTWQDNASNEMGYFIERSTSPTTGFAPIGGVGPNVTTFIDQSFTTNTRYYYRVKGSNTTTGSISATATVIAPVAPGCHPYFDYDGCSFGINIAGVTVNSTVLSQTGCSPVSSGYYTSFSAVSGTVTAGQSATFTVAKGTQYPVGGSIWVDLNNNTVFEAGEKLYQMPAANTSGTFSGSFAIPASTTATSVAMRVVVAYATVPGDPCGSYGYGETEDYILKVNKASDLTPIVYARPNIVYGLANLTVVVDVVELNSSPTSGTLTVRLTKDAKASLSFPQSATSVGGRGVQNSVWSFTGSDPNYYLLTTSQSIAAGDKLSFGLLGTLSPGATTGQLSVSSILLTTGMSEASQSNNADADKVEYFQQ